MVNTLPLLALIGHLFHNLNPLWKTIPPGIYATIDPTLF